MTRRESDAPRLPGTADLRLAALMLANHETGAVQPAAELAAALPRQVVLHCDAAAAVGKMPVSFRTLGVSTLTVSAHKFHGPQGAGALLLRRGTRLRPLFFGGHQQHGHRPGTEPVHLAVGLAVALDLAVREMDQRLAKVRRLRQSFLDQLQPAAPFVVNGPALSSFPGSAWERTAREALPRSPEAYIPHVLNISFPGCRADLLLMSLDLAGVACSTGSACSSGSLLPSPVLKAMAVPDARLHSAMRFSFSHVLSETEVDDAARRIAAVVSQLRSRGEASAMHGSQKVKPAVT